MTRSPRLEPGRNGIARDLAFRVRRLGALPAPVAELANTVAPGAEKGDLEAGDFLALVTAEGEVRPLALDTLKQWLEATYVLTPQP